MAGRRLHRSDNTGLLRSLPSGIAYEIRRRGPDSDARSACRNGLEASPLLDGRYVGQDLTSSPKP